MLRSGGLLLLGVTRAHVMPTFARVARNNSIPKRDIQMRRGTRDTYTQCRASRSELVRLKVLVCEHDCCNRSMHDTVLGSLDGYIIVFLLSLKRVLWSMRELAKRLALSFPSSPPFSISYVVTCARTRRI